MNVYASKQNILITKTTSSYKRFIIFYFFITRNSFCSTNSYFAITT
ncbi:hypothetical protein PROSTU_02102 [Providencia stuartii ATCC 25827]|uniref:Uncharacterized protein n=1 Tax=Providencia stuartii ATCC 25827 TaxID=471874 RepID=A0AA87CQI0_PROST|nr:hypothetical protein PROSTU_02102 [Providencia stuartii ATCC 25827]